MTAGLVAVAPAAQAAPKPKVNTSVSISPANPQLTGQPMTVTLGYSCASPTVDCVGSTMSVVLSTYLADPTNVSTTPHIQSWSYSAATKTITYTFVNPLHAGSSGQLQFTTSFPQGTSANNQNATITATMSSSSGASSSATATATSSVNNQWYTKISLASGGSINNNATYNVSYCVNASSYGQINVLAGSTLVDALPAGATFVSATNGGVYNAATHRVTWAVGPLSYNTGGTCWTPQMTLFYGNPPFVAGQNVTNTVSATAKEPGPNGTVASVNLAGSSFTTTILPAAGTFAISKTCQTSAVSTMTAWCTITVTNTGNVPIAPSWIDMFPQGFSIQPGAPVAIGNTNGMHVSIYYATDKAAAPGQQRTPTTWYALAANKVGVGPSSTVNAPASLAGGATMITGLEYVYTDNFAPGASTTTTNWMYFSGQYDNGTAIPNNTVLQNCAKVNWVFNGAKSSQSCFNISASIPTPTVNVSKTNSGANLYPGTALQWTVTATNNGNVPEMWTAIDLIPQGFSIAPGGSIGIGNTNGLTVNIYYATDQQPRTPVSQWYQLAGGPFTGAAAATATAAPASLPGNATKITALKYVFTAAVQPGGTWQVNELTPFTPTWDNGTTIPSGTSLQNCMTITTTFNAYNGSGQGCSTRVVTPVSDIYTYKSGGAASYTIANANQQVNFPLYLSNRSGSWYGITDPIIADVVPPQAAPWNGTWAASYQITNAGGLAFNAASDFSVTQMTTAGVPDGRYALRWKFHGTLNPNGVVQITLRTKALSALPYTNYDDHIWAAAATMPVPPTTCSAPAANGGIGLSVDSENVLGLGSSYQACHSKWGFQLSPVAALDSTALVKGQLDAGYSNYPAQGESVTGGKADYRVTVTNSGTVGMKNAVVIDVLPFVGDTAVLSNTPRNSQYGPNLAGAVVPSDPKIVVWYSTRTNPCMPELSYSPVGCAAPGWTTTAPFDITTVRSVKFDFSALVLAPQQTFQLDWPMRVPNGTPAGLLAWDSVGYTATRVDTNQTLLPSEPFAIGIHTNPAVPNFIGDFVWQDANHNGLQDAGEKGVNGVPVFLYTSTGVFVDKSITGNNFSGQPGYYSFGSLPDGDYYLQFDLTKLPSYDQVTLQDVGANDQIDSDMDATGRSPTIHVAGNVTDYSWDMGVWANICDVVCGAPTRLGPHR